MRWGEFLFSSRDYGVPPDVWAAVPSTIQHTRVIMSGMNNTVVETLTSSKMSASLSLSAFDVARSNLGWKVEVNGISPNKREAQSSPRIALRRRAGGLKSFVLIAVRCPVRIVQPETRASKTASAKIRND